MTGIVKYTTYTPENTMTADALSQLTGVPADVLREKMGIRRIHVAGPEDQPGAMAVQCCRRLLTETGMNPLDIDMILYAGETYAEYVCWTVAIKVQEEIGAKNAYAWDLSFRCAGLPLALKVAKDMMTADASLKNVLVCCGNINAQLVDYKDPSQTMLFNMGPGAFALLLQQGYGANEVLGTGIITDSQFHSDVIGLHGGSLNPLTQEMVMEMASDPEKTRKFNLLSLPDAAGMKKRLGEASLPNFANCVRLACEKSGIQPGDIDFIGVVHIGNRAHYGLMKELGIAEEKTVFLWDDGHCGQVDPLLALDYAIAQGLVKEGSFVALVGAGTGYAFACTIIKWGEANA
ncbi:MAG: 3-oxoacyl-ACP synthase [Defluviitaleaceae bacterium]|nr:3-oxoacyl-ACP synthase [Defluviitaleaceae bacterium]MCL2239596.1 3-oxoacyl-ACP synthase [Defluviitaleaceae bacterium]